MKTQIYHYHSRVGCKFFTGGLLIAIGLVLLGLNLGIITPALKPVIFSWQMLLILIGVCGLFHCRFWSGIILTLIGIFFIIPKLQFAGIEMFTQLPENFTQTCYPFLLIAAGVLIIIFWMMPHKWKNCHSYGCGKKACKSGGDFFQNTNTNGFCGRNVFSGGEHTVNDEVFTGGKIDAVFGSSVIDLRHTTLPENGASLEVNSVFGGVQIFVPQTWHVELQTSSVLGGFSDTRLVDSTKIDYSRKLVIKGSFVFGGGEIKN